jgi:hypothetical protein
MSDSGPIRYRLNPPGNPFALWSLLLGVAGFCVPFVGGAAAVVLGVLGILRAKRVFDGYGVALTGLVLGLISIASYAGMIAAGWGVAAFFGGSGR